MYRTLKRLETGMEKANKYWSWNVSGTRLGLQIEHKNNLLCFNVIYIVACPLKAGYVRY
jgi:hypothetical protein